MKSFFQTCFEIWRPSTCSGFGQISRLEKLGKTKLEIFDRFFQTCVECKYICPETKSKLFHYQIMFNQSSQSSPLPKKILKEQNKMFLFLNLFFTKELIFGRPNLEIRVTLTGQSSQATTDCLLPACVRNAGDFAWQRYSYRSSDGQGFSAEWALKQAHHARCSLQIRLLCRREACTDVAHLLAVCRDSGLESERCARSNTDKF